MTITAGAGFSGTVNLTVSGVPAHHRGVQPRIDREFRDVRVDGGYRQQRSEANPHGDDHGHGRRPRPLGERDLDHSVGMAISRRTLLGRLGAGAAVAAAGASCGWRHSAPTGRQQRRRASDPAGRFGCTGTRTSGPSPKGHRRDAGRPRTPACRYPDAEAEALRRRIAGLHAVAPEQVVLGCGSGEILRMAIDAFAGPQKNIVAALPTFESIAQYARRAGAEVVDVPLSKDWSHDVGAMLARTDASTGLVYICNPNNPTGSLTRRQDIEEFLRKLPADVCRADRRGLPSLRRRVTEYASFIDRPVDNPRVIVTRTFSKIHGLAGLRVGYAVAAPQTARVTLGSAVGRRQRRRGTGRRRRPRRTEYVRLSVGWNADDRQEFLNHASARMVRSIDSLANFVMLKPAGRLVRCRAFRETSGSSSRALCRRSSPTSGCPWARPPRCASSGACGTSCPATRCRCRGRGSLRSRGRPHSLRSCGKAGSLRSPVGASALRAPVGACRADAHAILARRRAVRLQPHPPTETLFRKQADFRGPRLRGLHEVPDSRDFCLREPPFGPSGLVRSACGRGERAKRVEPPRARAFSRRGARMRDAAGAGGGAPAPSERWGPASK